MGITKRIRKFKIASRQFGFVGGIRFSYEYMRRYKTTMREGEKRVGKYHVNSIGTDVFYRTGTSDFMLFSEFFFDAEKIPVPVQYDIDFEKLVGYKPRYILDAGANIGLFTLMFNALYKPNRIIAVEPEESNIDVLKKTYIYMIMYVYLGGVCGILKRT